MRKQVLDVGQCAPDHASIRRLLETNFNVLVVQADALSEALDQLRSGAFALVLVNRQLDVDASDGLDIVRAIKADRQLAATPVMLVTNYPDWQERAVAAGAVPGFGKATLHAAATLETLRPYLG